MGDCRVEIRGHPSTLHIADIRNCEILSGPVHTSVLADSCHDCKLLLSCQQLRLHRSTNSHLYLHTTSRPVIEECKGLGVAPFSPSLAVEMVSRSPSPGGNTTWSYPDIADHYEEAGLDREINLWDQMADFDWLAKDKKSPNWDLIPVEER